MKTELIDQKYRKYSAAMITGLRELTAQLDDPDFSSLSREFSNLINSFKQPFMFVVIGEVKSGKSSFVNSLTGESICGVDADICTDRVQQIEYSEIPFVKHMEDYLDIKGIPAQILKDISIVDTPGTDSIIAEHEEITRRFAPNSNIIFFVFPALNPHHSSSWDMLNIMKDKWSRNIIFIAAQSDRCTERELETGLTKIRHYAQERGIADPVIFPTSSKWEIEGQDGKSGFREIRSFISDTTRGGRHMILKLRDRMEIAEILMTKTERKLALRSEILEKDRQLRNRISIKYESGRENSIREIEKILERMSFVFERTSNEYVDRLKRSLSTGNILRQALPIPRLRRSRHKVDRQYLEGILNDMNRDLTEKLGIEASDNASFFIDGIKFRFSEIIREVEKAKEIDDSDASDRALDSFISRREEILSEILKGLTDMSTDLSLVTNLEKHNPDIGETVLKGGVLAAAGALLSIVAQGAVFDATGGILSALGILGAGGIILFKRSRLIREFRKNIESSNVRFVDELQSRFEKRMNLIFEDIFRLFERIDKHISVENAFIESVSSSLKNRRKELAEIKSDL